MKSLKVKNSPGGKKSGKSVPLDPPVQGRLTKRSLESLQRAHTAEERENESAEALPRPASVPIAKDKDTASVATSRKTRGTKVEFTSFLDDEPVEACLEYLTRPHRSWESALNFTYDRQRRVENHRASVFSRSLTTSRNTSFILNSSIRSIASAPAGFPLTAKNGSKTKTGSLVPSGRLGSPTPSVDKEEDLELRLTGTPRIEAKGPTSRSTSPGALARGSTVTKPKSKSVPGKSATGKKSNKKANADDGLAGLAIGPVTSYKPK